MSAVRLCKSIARLSGQAARARLATGLGVRAVAASLSRARPAAVAANTLAARAALLGGVRAASTGAAAAKLQALSPSDTFPRRHLGPNGDDVQKMLRVIGEPSIDALIDKTVPKQIRSKKELAIGAPRTEAAVLSEFKAMMGKNQIYRSHLGTGYYDTIVPPVILRNLMENPAWYTPYTPYQAEIAQGRLEMLLNFQTMVADLTGLAISNCSLLDEGTAAAEAMKMCHDMAHSRTAFLVADNVHPQTLAVVKTRAESFGISVRVSAPSKFDLSKGDVFGVLLQYPATDGSIASLESYAKLTADAQAAGAKVVVATDLLALTLLAPPGEWGADIAVGSTQRFGVPMGFGGPHAAFLATSDAHKRKLPGRVIGVSKDSRGKTALRMAMQTREQHIRRDKASSNICTAQALLANMSAAYAIYHGPKGLKEIAARVHGLTRTAAACLSAVGAHLSPQQFFDTLRVQVQGNAAAYVAAAHKRRIGVRQLDANTVTLSFDETTTFDHVDDVVAVFADVNGVKPKHNARAVAAATATEFPAALTRKTPYLTHAVFNSYHSETEMLRYLYKLQSKDLSLATAMIPLGSCTMKLNATTEMIPVTWPEVNALHPFVAPDQAKGYAEMLADLSRDLCNITGFAAVSLQPNAGSQGEYAGLRVISAYHASRGDAHRNICLIPTSAHGTNPASAVMAGLKVVAVACDEKGNIDVADLKAKAKLHAKNLHSLMVTYPSTHGVFEESIKDICAAIHENGGQVYMDGANMNAQVGLCSPGEIGADVCHLNLHKTFCIPHGGGGPGMGPIGVAKQLAPFLPGHPLVSTGGAQAMGPVSAAPFSSASILPISYLYIKMMGSAGLKAATETAILNANYMAKRLAPHYKILYTGANGTCAHEFIIDLRPLKAATGVVEEDVAKRLLDFNFHAPTMSFPVPGTLMVEPTESESLAELDRFCDAMIHIRAEIRDIETGKADRKLNVLKGAPHTADVVVADKWDRPYSREAAAYPLPYLRANKFWPSVGRLDNVYGDRNLVCSCPPMESYL